MKNIYGLVSVKMVGVEQSIEAIHDNLVTYNGTCSELKRSELDNMLKSIDFIDSLTLIMKCFDLVVEPFKIYFNYDNKSTAKSELASILSFCAKYAKSSMFSNTPVVSNVDKECSEILIFLEYVKEIHDDFYFNNSDGKRINYDYKHHSIISSNNLSYINMKDLFKRQIFKYTLESTYKYNSSMLMEDMFNNCEDEDIIDTMYYNLSYSRLMGHDYDFGCDNRLFMQYIKYYQYNNDEETRDTYLACINNYIGMHDTDVMIADEDDIYLYGAEFSFMVTDDMYLEELLKMSYTYNVVINVSYIDSKYMIKNFIIECGDVYADTSRKTKTDFLLEYLDKTETSNIHLMCYDIPFYDKDLLKYFIVKNFGKFNTASKNERLIMEKMYKVASCFNNNNEQLSLPRTLFKKAPNKQLFKKKLFKKNVGNVKLAKTLKR